MPRRLPRRGIAIARWALALTCIGHGAAPRLGAHAAPTEADYGKLPAFEFIRLSPSGNRIATLLQLVGRRQVVVSELGSKPLYSIDIASEKARDLRWIDEDHVLLLKSATLKNRLRAYGEYTTALSIDVGRQSNRFVFDHEPGVARLISGVVDAQTIDGHSYAWFGGFENFYGVSQLYRVDMASFETRRMTANDGYTVAWAVGSKGEILARMDVGSDSKTWELHRGTQRNPPVLQFVSEFADVQLIGRGRTADSVLLSDTSGDGARISELTLGDGKRTPLFDGSPVDDLLIDRSTDALIGAMYDGNHRARFFDPLLQARYDGAKKAFPNAQVALASFSHDLARMVLHTTGDDDSGTYWLVDVQAGTAKRVGADYPTVSAADVCPTRTFHYVAGDGLAIEAILTLPRGRPEHTLPVVVMPHGGPMGIRDQRGFDWWAQAYAHAGYVVLQPNYRGSSGYGDAHLRAGLGEYGRKMQSDLSDGLNALAATGLVDPSRACIVGGSYGGYAALAGVTLQRGLYRCAIAVAGLSDLPTFRSGLVNAYGPKSPPMRYLRAMYGEDTASDAALRAISPAEFAANADAPIMLIHGTDDSVVPYRQSETMASALASEHKPFELVRLSSEDHWLSRAETRTAMLEASLRFLRTHNPPDAMPPP